MTQAIFGKSKISLEDYFNQLGRDLYRLIQDTRISEWLVCLNGQRKWEINCKKTRTDNVSGDPISDGFYEKSMLTPVNQQFYHQYKFCRT